MKLEIIKSLYKHPNDYIYVVELGNDLIQDKKETGNTN